MRPRSGLALILVVGVLGVLAVLGSAFAVLSQMERRNSKRWMHATQAQLLARSGLEDALARVAAGQDQVYGGEDWALDGWDAYDQSQEVYRPGSLNVGDCPVRQALRPSYFVREGTGKPKRILVDGRERGYSGRLSQGSYALKVVGNDGIYLNGGDTSSAGEHPGTYDVTLRRILENLGEELAPTLSSADMTGLLTLRPAGGWVSLEQASASLGWTPAKLQAVRPYLCTSAWVDRKVIRPNVDPAWAAPAGLAGASTASTWAEIKVGQRDTPVPVPTSDPSVTTGAVGALWTGKRAFNARTGSYAPDFERDSLGIVVGRAPVNLNWARVNPPVMKALLKGLAAIRLNPSYMRTLYSGTPFYFWDDYGFLGAINRVQLDAADLGPVAASFQSHTGFPTWAIDYPDWDQTAAFDSWDEFSRFVDLKLAGVLVSDVKRDILKANFNPNTALNKFNPGETYAKTVDKSDLVAYSTEFSFRTPSHVLSATGRLLDAQGRLLAERTLSGVVRYGQVRLTSQSEFCAEDLGNPDLAGDETAFRLPGDAGFIEETGNAEKTFGSRYPGLAKGLSLQTYPEPQWRGGGCPVPACYDGRLELATTEAEASPVANPGLTFLASFDNGFDATYALGVTACTADQRMAPVGISIYGTAAVGPKAIVNTLYPDGCYAEAFRAPGYEARDNIGDGVQGLFSAWYKPAFGPDFGTGASSDSPGQRGRGFTLLHLVNLGVVPTGSVSSNAQSLVVGGWRDYFGRAYWGGIAETGYFASDTAHEQGARFDPGWKTFWHANRWHLVTFQWNLRGTTPPTFSAMSVNGTPGSGVYYLGSWNPDGLGASLTRDCWREDSEFGTPYFCLGIRGVTQNTRGSADGTVDEVAFFSRTSDMGECQILASNRFQHGRYSKEDSALDPARPEYRSAPIRLGPGATLLRVDWTLVLPRIFRAPTSVPDLWPAPNQVFFGTGATPSGETADAVIRLLDPVGDSLHPVRLTRSGGPVDVRPPGGVLRLGLDLRPRLSDNVGVWAKPTAPLLESPVLDDVTLTWSPDGGPRMTKWREGE